MPTCNRIVQFQKLVKLHGISHGEGGRTQRVHAQRGDNSVSDLRPANAAQQLRVTYCQIIGKNDARCLTVNASGNQNKN